MSMNAKPPSPAEVLILGMLYTKPLHGYELNKLLEERGVRQWANIGFSSIYYLLEKLENRGLIKTKGAVAKARKTFSITSEGKKVCKAQTKKLLSQRVANKNPVMTGLANSFVLSDAAFRKLLQARHDALSDQHAQLTAQKKAQQPLPKQAELLFSFSLSQIKSEKDWVENELAQLGDSK